MDKLKLTFNATALLYLQLVILLALVIGAGFGFYYAKGFLTNTVSETANMQAQVELSQQNIHRLKILESKLANMSEVVSQTKQIIGSSQHYQYQDQIIKDIDTYASRTGVDVVGYDFGDPTSKAKNDTILPSIKGAKIITAQLQLADPVELTNLLNFLQAIEQNLTKMQVTGVNIMPDQTNADNVSNSVIGLQIYVKG